MERDGWWWAARGHHQPIDQAADSSGEMLSRRLRPAACDQTARITTDYDADWSAASVWPTRPPTDELERGAVIQLDVMKRIGEDFCRPGQAGHAILYQEQLNGAEQQAADADDEP